MKSIKILTLMTAGVICLASSGQPAHAAQEAKDSEIILAGAFTHTSGSDVGTLNLDLAYGYYLTKNWEVGVSQTLGYSFVDDGEDIWSASTIPFIYYNFCGLTEGDIFQPFIGAFIGAAYNEDDTTGTAGPVVGVKSFLDTNTFISVKYRYEWFFDDLEYEDVTDTGDGNHIAALGLGFIW